MFKIQLRKYIPKRPFVLALALVVVLANLAVIPRVFAGTFSYASVTELGGASGVNPMIAADGQSLAVAFTPATTTSTNPSITLTFTGWTGSTNGIVNATQTISNTGCTSLTGASTGLPGTLSASGSGAVLTISLSGGSDALTSGTSYCTELTSTTAVTNPSAAGSYNVTISDTSDSITNSIDVLSSGANAYTIGATVGSTFTMALSGNTDSFSGNLSSSADSSSTGITTTVNTNAANGWLIWAEDANSGLKSTSTGHTIASVASGSNYNFATNTGTEGYGLGVSADATTAYADSGGNTGGALSSSTFYEIASSTSTATNVTFTTKELANISSTTPPASDYTDTITEIGAGSF